MSIPRLLGQTPDDCFRAVSDRSHDPYHSGPTHTLLGGLFYTAVYIQTTHTFVREVVRELHIIADPTQETWHTYLYMYTLVLPLLVIYHADYRLYLGLLRPATWATYCTLYTTVVCNVWWCARPANRSALESLCLYRSWCESGRSVRVGVEHSRRRTRKFTEKNLWVFFRFSSPFFF